MTEPNILVNIVLWQSSVFYPLPTQFLFKNLLSILGLCDSGRVDFRPSSSLAFPNSRCYRSRSDHPRTSWMMWWETDLGMAYNPKLSCERQQDPIFFVFVCANMGSGLILFQYLVIDWRDPGILWVFSLGTENEVNTAEYTVGKWGETESSRQYLISTQTIPKGSYTCEIFIEMNLCILITALILDWFLITWYWVSVS